MITLFPHLRCYIALLSISVRFVSEAVPSNVTATRGETNRVVVQWCGTNTYYQVYNQTTAVSGWIATNRFEHTSSARGVVYRYRVKESASADGSGASGFSADTTAAIGFLGFPLSDYAPTSAVGLTLNSSGTSEWVGQYATDGVSQQLVSGWLSNYGETTSLDITVRGGGVLSFDWKVDSNVINNGLFIYVNGNEVWESPMTANSNWSPFTQNVSATADDEETIISIAYEKYGSGAGLDCAWVQNLVWTPAVSTRLDAPGSVQATDGLRLESVAVSWSPVTEAFYYRVWRATNSNGTDRVVISAGWQTGTNLFDVSTDVQGGNPFWYFVEAATSVTGDRASYLSLPDSGYALKRAANDYLWQAISLGEVSAGVVTGTCDGATSGSGEPMHAGVASATNSVWWVWTSPDAGYERFSVRGSDAMLPLVVAVYTNSGSNVNLSSLCGVGFAQAGTNGWSAVQIPVIAGQSYFLAVAGENGASGPLVLSWEPVWSKSVPANVRATQGTLFEKVRIDWDAVPDATHYEVWRQTSLQRPDAKRIGAWQEACSFEDSTAKVGVRYYYSVRATVDAADQAAGGLSAPVAGFSASYPLNDNRASAPAITGCYGETQGANAWATGEAGEPIHGGVTGAVNSVWWTWVAPTNASFTFTVTPQTNALWRPVLAIYTNGVSAGILWPVTSGCSLTNGVKTQVTFAAAAGQTYDIAVAGCDGSGGAFSLNWALSLGLPSGVMASDGTEFWMTVIQWEPVPGATSYEVSRSLEPDGAREILSGWITESFFEDWTGSLGVPYNYYVRARTEAWGGLLSGYSQATVGRAGDFPPNDNRVDAVLLSGVSGSAYGESLWATREAGEPQHGGFSDAGASIWWVWTAPVSAPVTFATQAGIAFNAVVAVYTNGAGGALVPVASAERGAGISAQVSFGARAGTAYFIAVAGRPNAGGPVTLGWSYGTWCFPAPPGLSATQATFNDRVEVAWGSVPEATVYELSRAMTSGGVATVVMGWTNAVSFVDTNVVPGQTYYYLVRAALDRSGTLAGASGGPAAGWARNAEPPASPAISGIAFDSVGGVPVLRATFEAQAGVVYEIKTASALGAGAVWRSLTPRVSVTAASDGVCTLEAPLESGVSRAFFRIEASRP